MLESGCPALQYHIVMSLHGSVMVKAEIGAIDGVKIQIVDAARKLSILCELDR